MDGNGRWAKKKGMPRNYGHLQGAKTLLTILSDAKDLGIKYLTVYAFSTENWNRPETEVSSLMGLLQTYLKNNIKTCMKNDVRCCIIGDRSRLSDEINDVIDEIEETTANNKTITFTIALNYGSRDEIRRAFCRISDKIAKGELSATEITEKVISDNLDTYFMPDPDLLIRTCNEQRISNFLLWQCAYAEFYYTPLAWPEFNKEELIKAVEAYSGRNRKYGGLNDAQN